MEERSAAVTMHGNPLTLVGQELNVGDAAPDLELLGNDLNAVKLSSFQGKVCIISAVPSLDTPTCDMETRRFNEAAGKLGDDVVILTVSMDLPCAVPPALKVSSRFQITVMRPLEPHLAY